MPLRVGRSKGQRSEVSGIVAMEGPVAGAQLVSSLRAAVDCNGARANHFLLADAPDCNSGRRLSCPDLYYFS